MLHGIVKFSILSTVHVHNRCPNTTGTGCLYKYVHICFWSNIITTPVDFNLLNTALWFFHWILGKVLNYADKLTDYCLCL